MSNSYNHVTLMGFLGNDPVRLPGARPLVKLSIAINEAWQKDGQKQERVDWFTVLLNGLRAEAAEKYLHKGDRILIEGKLKTRTYQKNGQSYYATFISAKNLQFLSTNNEKADKTIHSDDDTDADDNSISEEMLTAA